MLSYVANALIEKQRVSLVENHKHGCPWKTRQCDGVYSSFSLYATLFISCIPNKASIYRIPLLSPATMAKHIKSGAFSLEPVLQGVGIKHPLVRLSIFFFDKPLTHSAFRRPPNSIHFGQLSTLSTCIVRRGL